MTCQYCYLTSYDSVSSPTPSNVWFASWTSGQSVTWSQTKPSAGNGVDTFAVAVICESSTRNDLTPLGNPKTMPPPMSAFSSTGNVNDFQDQFKAWTLSDRSFSLPADARIA